MATDITERPKLVRLIYYSHPSHGLEQHELGDILREARERNTREQITGMLAFSPDYFLQVIEGAVDSINDLYFGLSRDQRHERLRLISYLPIEERLFSDWSMALANLPEFPGRFLDQHLGGYRPPNFSPQRALEYLEILRDYMMQTGRGE
ncbi:BLUF domain-containing protein [Proteobacteria bacterium 005FR1]|nr:BLUF domain-containing protein [Proteobacteria bacterium 005FR1]